MSDLFSELEAFKNNGGPPATLLRQVRALAGVREAGKHRYQIDAGVELAFVQKDGQWLAQLDKSGRIERLPIASATEQRKLIDRLKLIAAGRDNE